MRSPVGNRHHSYFWDTVFGQGWSGVKQDAISWVLRRQWARMLHHLSVKICMEMRRCGTTDIVELSRRLNLVIRGWYNYFGKYCPSEALRKDIYFVNLRLVRWLKRTRKKVKRSIKKSQHLLHCITKLNPNMFYHWKVGYMLVKWWQEPNDERLSSTVPWETWGEIPFAYSIQRGVQVPHRCDLKVVAWSAHKRCHIHPWLLYHEMPSKWWMVWSSGTMRASGSRNRPTARISNFMGYLKGKSTLMIYDRYLELQSKWNKAFWARGYYMETNW